MSASHTKPESIQMPGPAAGNQDRPQVTAPVWNSPVHNQMKWRSISYHNMFFFHELYWQDMMY